MVECGVCGNNQRRLYCSGCASTLTLRARINVIKVMSQLSGLEASVMQALDGKGSPAIGSADAANGGNEAHTIQLRAKINLLQKKLHKVQSEIVSTNHKTLEIKQQTENIRESNAKARASVVAIDRNAETQFEEYRDSRASSEKLFEKGYRDMLHLSLGLQTKSCKDLLEIFVLKKKRRKDGYEIVLGYNVVPELAHLGHYSVTTINSGLERVSTFAILLASYLGIRLPYEIQLPQKSKPKVTIGTGHEPLWLPHSAKTMMRSSSREFHNYCRLIAMLALDMAHIALKLGLPSVTDMQDIAKLNQLVAQVYLRVENLIKSGHQIKIYSGVLVVDLDSLQDHLITVIDIELNGKSAEWNIVEAP